VVLGKACRVGRALVANAALLDGVSVDDKAEIGSSIIGAGSAIGEGAVVRDSILEDGVQIAPHARIEAGRVTA
jgi:NDP-sugar pyrophosphorylase family protein